jgi:hypothetical protein
MHNLDVNQCYPRFSTLLQKFSQFEGRLFELNTPYVIYYKLKMQQIKDPKPPVFYNLV